MKASRRLCFRHTLDDVGRPTRRVALPLLTLAIVAGAGPSVGQVRRWVDEHGVEHWESGSPRAPHTPSEPVSVEVSGTAIKAPNRFRVRPGYREVVVTVTVTRDVRYPERKASLSPWNFALITADGVLYKARIALRGDPSPVCEPNVEVLTNGKATCDIVFEVPTSIRSAVIQFSTFNLKSAPIELVLP